MSFSSLKAPFVELHALLSEIEAGDLDVINLALGEPTHRPPDFVSRLLVETIDRGGLNRYPTVLGINRLRQACADWLERRFSVSVDYRSQILPVCGTREGLFLMGLCAAHYLDKKDGVMFVPDPGYQCYSASAVGAGCLPIYIAADKASGFLPDLDFLEEQLKRHYFNRAVAFFLCSPANPQGVIADEAYLNRSIQLAQRYNFIVIIDECYAEIYDKTPPHSILEFGARSDFKNIIAFHSLSKRSNVANLRSGFCAGDARLMKAYRLMRALGGVAMPLFTQKVSAALWSDDDHVEKNRAYYQEKFDDAETMLGAYEGFYRPEGGFFLWFDLSALGINGEQMAVKLWQQAGVRVLPGNYLSQRGAGADYLRIALVANKEKLKDGFQRIKGIFDAK